jgi:hypothetical protein
MKKKVLIGLAILVVMAFTASVVVQPEQASARTLQVQVKGSWSYVGMKYVTRAGTIQVWGPWGYYHCSSFCSSTAQTTFAPVRTVAVWNDAGTGVFTGQIRWSNGQVSSITSQMNWWNTSLTLLFTSPL